MWLVWRKEEANLIIGKSNLLLSHEKHFITGIWPGPNYASVNQPAAQINPFINLFPMHPFSTPWKH